MKLKEKIIRKKEEKKEQPEKKRKRIVPSTQQNIPIKDFANGTIITSDKRMLKMIEITPIPFSNLKNSQKNQIRQSFENLLKNMPDSFQIKCVSTPADLTKQIAKIDESIRQETNEECIQLSEEYKKSLISAQKNNVERQFYLVISNEETTRKSKQEELSAQIYKLNSVANRICDSLKNCGNRAKPLNNNEIANVLYMLLNRNTYNEVSFEQHYEDVYNKYINILGKNKKIYIPPTEYIAPNAFYFNDRKFVMCDNKLYTYLYIANDGYPNDVVCGWLDLFVNTFEGVDVDIFVKKKDKRTTKEALLKTVGHTDMDLSESTNDESDSFNNAIGKYQSAKFLLACLRSGQAIYDVSIILTISGNNVEDISRNIESIIDDARSYDIRLRDLAYQNEKAFISTLPLNSLAKEIEIKAKRNMPQCTVATLYPFTTFQLIHDNGLYIADGLGSTPVIPDFWNTKFVSNPLVFMCGMAGAGKTSALELIACHARAMNIPVFIVAPEKQDDYKRLCDALGGQFIDIGTGSPYRINIMEIFENDKNVQEANDTLYGKLSSSNTSYLNQRSAVVFEFLHANYPGMSEIHQGVLKGCILETYRKFGITEDNESLWADKEKTHYKKMPILSDLLEVIKSKGKDYETLYYSVRSLTEGSGAHFNGQTNVDIKNKFFVIGTENNSKETKTLSSFLAEDFCQMKIREDRITKTVFIIDEGWAMLNNPYTADKMYEDSKILRGFMCMFIFATQQMADCLNNEKGVAVLNNAESRIIMKHKDEDIKYISQYIDLSENERKQIRAFDVGQALLLANQVRLPIYFNPTEFEKLLTWNDTDTLGRYAQYIVEKRKREEIEAKKKKISNKAGSMKDMLYDPRQEYKRCIDSEQLAYSMFMNATPTGKYRKKVYKGG